MDYSSPIVFFPSERYYRFALVPLHPPKHIPHRLRKNGKFVGSLRLACCLSTKENILCTVPYCTYTTVSASTTSFFGRAVLRQTVVHAMTSRSVICTYVCRVALSQHAQLSLFHLNYHHNIKHPSTASSFTSHNIYRTLIYNKNGKHINIIQRPSKLPRQGIGNI